MIEMTPFPLRGDRPAWSTAVGLGPIPYRFAGSNPAPRTMILNTKLSFIQYGYFRKLGLCHYFAPNQSTLP
mgnify:CR=1 FL=1|jgi:hypothetical protein